MFFFEKSIGISVSLKSNRFSGSLMDFPDIFQQPSANIAKIFRIVGNFPYIQNVPVILTDFLEV